MTARVGIGDLPNFASLVGKEWLAQIIRGERRQGEHPLKSFWDQTFDGRDSVLAGIDRALAVLAPALGVVADDGRDPAVRLGQKLRNGRGFWSAVAEVVWGARLSAIGQVTIEPFAKGPDFRVQRCEEPFFVEVYSPVEPMSVHEDVEFRLHHRWRHESPEGRAVRIDIFDDHLERNPRVLHPLVDRIEQASARIRSSVARSVAVHRRGEYEWEEVTDVEEWDAARDYRRGPLAAFVSSPPHLDGQTGRRVMTTSTSSAALGESRNPYRGLRQLRRDAANVLVLDRSQAFLREWSEPMMIHGPEGPFANHPELAGLVLSRWHADSAPGVKELVEDHVVHESRRADSLRLPGDVIALLGRPGLF